jgi:hypothetical protein
MNDKAKNVAIVVSYVAFLGVIAYSHAKFLKALADKTVAEPTFEEQIENMHRRSRDITDRIQADIDAGRAGGNSN